MSKNIQRLFNNLEHIQIIDKWFRIGKYENIEQDRFYLASKIKQYFPEYRECDCFELSDSLESIFAIE